MGMDELLFFYCCFKSQMPTHAEVVYLVLNGIVSKDDQWRRLDGS